MTTITSFVERLKKIGINIELAGNYPWIYLEKVNGVRVKERYLAEHGFTAFWYGTKAGEQPRFTDIEIVFKKIREILNANTPKV